MSWEKGFENIATDYAILYTVNPKDAIRMLAFNSVNGSLNESYQHYVRREQLIPIESLDQKKKVELWNVAKELSDNKKRREWIARSLYLLQELTK